MASRAISSLARCLEQLVQAVSDLAVGGAGLVLVDQCGSFVVVAHAGNQVAQRDAHIGGKRVAGMPEGRPATLPATSRPESAGHAAPSGPTRRTDRDARERVMRNDVL